MATGIGETLRAARRQQGVSLADAAAETRVRESYLAALEEEDFAALGGDVYVKGFLRSYARFLRLDPEPLLASYRSQYERPTDEPQLAPPMSVSSMPTERRPTVVVAVGVGVLVLALLAVIGLIGGGDDTPPEQLAGAPDPAPTTQSSGAPVTPNPLPTEPPDDRPFDQLRVRFEVLDSEAWMRVTVDGAIERQDTQTPGTVESYKPSDSIILRVGDAAAVQITVNGEVIENLGEPGQVVEVTCEIGQTQCDVVPIT